MRAGGPARRYPAPMVCTVIGSNVVRVGERGPPIHGHMQGNLRR